MNKTTEALKLAEEALKYGELYGGWPLDSRCSDALAAIREALAEQEKQEPVAHYKDAPHTIYLQTGCDDPEDCECSFNEWGDTTWCADQIHDTDIPYIRADYAAPVSAEPCKECDAKQAKIDSLMLEYCPDEITDEQMTEWRHSDTGF